MNANALKKTQQTMAPLIKRCKLLSFMRDTKHWNFLIKQNRVKFVIILKTKWIEFTTLPKKNPNKRPNKQTNITKTRTRTCLQHIFDIICLNLQEHSFVNILVFKTFLLMFLLEIEYNKTKCKTNNLNAILFCDKK